VRRQLTLGGIIGAIMGWAELGYENASAHPLFQQRFDKIRGRREEQLG